MANPNLVAFLEKLAGELDNYADYRKELNRQPQTFVFHKTSLLNETVKQLQQGHDIKLTTDQKKKLKELVDIAAADLHKQLEQIAGHKLKRPGGRTTVNFTDDTEVPIPAHYDKFLPYSAFSRVKFAYRGVMNEYFQNMQDYLRDQTTHDVVRTKSGKEKRSIMHFFDAGHEEGAGVFEKFLDAKTIKIMSEMDKTMETFSDNEIKTLQKDLEEMGIDLSIQKLDKSDMIIIKIESASVNRSRGAKSGLRSKNLRKQIREFLSQPKADLENLRGSDSLKERKIKKTRKAIVDPFKKQKNVKVTSKGIETKDSSKSPVKKKVTPKVTKKKTKLNTTVSVRKKRRKKVRASSAATQPLELLGILNARLPEIVRKNMREPGLVNRSGRFADSVKVTEITKTQQGFPSIGYTYQKNPYEVFEMGNGDSRWATPERDPRILIDRSIREVAAQFAIGRFYTRRV